MTKRKEQPESFGILVDDVFMSKDNKTCIIKGFKDDTLNIITAFAPVKPNKTVHMPQIGKPKLITPWVMNDGSPAYSFKVQ